jgi:type VI secretion system protein ImpH
VTLKDQIAAQPHLFDMFKVLREYERTYREKPRIGDAAVINEEIIVPVQDPYMEFADHNITTLDTNSRGVPRLHTRFLGYFGPHGALPLSTTAEVYDWFRHNDPAFVRFADIFATRFLELFYRAWADARPIAQHDRPNDDRFAGYIGTFSGIGTKAFRDRDSLSDIAKISYSGLVGARVKSARRLSQLIRGVLKLDATIVERIGSWLLFEPSDIMAVGQNGSSLGVDTFLGVRSYSIGDKFRINIRTTSLEQYRSLLPGSKLAEQLADLVFYDIGYRYEYDVELSLPARLAPPTRLGESGQLGWTAWVAPPPQPEGSQAYVSDARFDLMERRRVAEAERKRSTQKKQRTG